MKDPFDVMPRATAEVFLRLQNEPLLRSFTLIGGTALALHLGHRRSEDLDFVTTEFKLPKTDLQASFEALRKDGYEVVDDDDYDAVFEFLNAGLELHDYSHTVRVNQSVSMTFFAGEEPEGKILSPDNATTGPRIATVKELAQLKALVARRRSKSRDWIDLYILDRDFGFSLWEWRKAYEQAGLSVRDFELAINRVCSGIRGAIDPGFHTLLANPPTVEQIVAHFRARRDEYEIERSSEDLGKGG